jgi:hypothetical protein
VPKVDPTGQRNRRHSAAGRLATYNCWNLRAPGHAVGEGYWMFGSAIALAVSQPAKAEGHDTRRSLADLYRGRVDYQRQVAAADAVNLFEAHARLVSPTLILSP